MLPVMCVTVVPVATVSHCVRIIAHLTHFQIYTIVEVVQLTV